MIFRPCVVVCTCALFVACKDKPDEWVPAGPSTTTPAATVDRPPSGPQPITIDEVRPLLPALPGTRMVHDLSVAAPTAIDGRYCFDKRTDNAEAANDVLKKLLEAGWESRPPRQTADANIIAIDARKRPYLMRATITAGSLAPAAKADAGAASDCKLTSQISVSYFISKNDASFGPR